MSPLSERIVAIPFSGGVDTRTDPLHVPPAKLTDLQNGVFTKATTISKRNGYEALSASISPGDVRYEDARGLAVRDGELVLFTGRTAYSYQAQADRWNEAGSVSSVVSTERALVKTGTEQSQVDYAQAGGVGVAAWKDSRGGVWWCATDAASGRVLMAPAQLLAGAVNPRVVAVGGRVHIYCAILPARRVYVTVVDAADPTATVTPSILVDDLAPSTYAVPLGAGTHGGCYDVAPATSGATVIAWPVDVGGYKVGYVDATGVLGSAVTGWPAPHHNAAAAVDGGLVGVAYHSTSIAVVHPTSGAESLFHTHDVSTMAEVHYDTVSSAGSLASVTAITAAFADTSGTLRLWVAEEVAPYGPPNPHNRDRRVYLSEVDHDGGAGLASETILGMCLASRPFVVGDVGQQTAAVWAVHDVRFFSVYLAIRVDGHVLARSMPIIAHGRSDGGWLSSANATEVDGDIIECALLYNEQLELGDDAASPDFSETGCRLVAVDFSHIGAWQSAQLGRGLYLASACPQHYDGRRWAEAGFHYGYDTNAGIANDDWTGAASGGSMADGVYTYRLVYEEIDALGEIHRGPPSVGTAVTVSGGGGSGSVTVDASGAPPAVTARGRVRIGIYRSTVDDTAAFYRVSSLDPSATGANGYVLDSVTGWTFTDGMSDAELLTKEPLYTNGGVTANDPAPFAGGVIAVGKRRMFWTDPTDPHVVRYSQELEDGYGVDMAAANWLRIDPIGDGIRAIAVMDDAVIVLKGSAIHAFAGPGPAVAPALDASLAFSPPALITSDTGCSDARGVAITPEGLAFKSPKGIRLLGRDRSLRDIGADVDGYNAQTVVAATTMPTESRVVFLTDEGRTLLWDYGHGQWSTFTNHEGLDAVVFGGVYHYLRTDGRVFRETDGVYVDDNDHVRRVVVTAWLKMTDYLQGWSKVLRALFRGHYISAHTLRIRYALDGEPGWSAPFDLDVDANHTITGYGDGNYGDGPYGGSGEARYQRSIHLNKRCQMIRFMIEDVESIATFGGAFELSELVLHGGVLRSTVKLSEPRSD